MRQDRISYTNANVYLCVHERKTINLHVAFRTHRRYISILRVYKYTSYVHAAYLPTELYKLPVQILCCLDVTQARPRIFGLVYL